MDPTTIPAALSTAAIEATAQRIAPHVRRAPLLPVDGADFGLAGAQLVFKLEYLQHAGSFKPRGAFNHLLTRALPITAARYGHTISASASKLGADCQPGSASCACRLL